MLGLARYLTSFLSHLRSSPTAPPSSTDSPSSSSSLRLSCPSRELVQFRSNGSREAHLSLFLLLFFSRSWILAAIDIRRQIAFSSSYNRIDPAMIVFGVLANAVFLGSKSSGSGEDGKGERG